VAKPSGYSIMSATAQTDSEGRYNNPGAPWYSEHSVRVLGLNHLAATAIQVILAGRPVKILEAYLSPSRRLIEAALTACFGGGSLVLMTGDLNAKHVDWNSWQKTRRETPT
jgi:hypothetical protein